MKKMLLFLILVVLMACSIPGFESHPSIVGNWVSDDSQVTLTFDANGKVTSTAGQSGTYTINYDYVPIRLDLVENGVATQAIIEFVDNNTLRIQVNPDGSRPAAFDQSAVLLRRK